MLLFFKTSYRGLLISDHLSNLRFVAFVMLRHYKLITKSNVILPACNTQSQAKITFDPYII